MTACIFSFYGNPTLQRYAYEENAPRQTAEADTLGGKTGHWLGPQISRPLKLAGFSVALLIIHFEILIVSILKMLKVYIALKFVYLLYIFMCPYLGLPNVRFLGSSVPAKKKGFDDRL